MLGISMINIKATRIRINVCTVLEELHACMSREGKKLVIKVMNLFGARCIDPYIVLA